MSRESKLNDTLGQRGMRYGPIHEEAEISQRILEMLMDHPGWTRLTRVMRHCLIMDAVKTARIINGDPFYTDNWHDKAGYATLVEKDIERSAIEIDQILKGKTAC